MNEKLIAFRVGVVVLAAATLAFGLIGIFGGGKGVFQRRYTVFLRFPSAPNVTVDTPVRKNGVLIGRVSNVELYDDYVKLSVGIDANRKLLRSEICRIKSASLVSGDAVLEFVPSSDKPKSTEFVNHGDWLNDGIVASDPLQVIANLEGDMQAVIVSAKGMADEMTILARGLNKTFGTNDQRLAQMMDKSEMALDTINGTMTNVNDVFGDPAVKQGLKQSLTELPETINNFNETMAQAGRTMESIEGVSRKAEQNLDNLAVFTKSLEEKGPQMVNDLARTAQNLEELMSQGSIFVESLNNPHGTLGKLINDREMYDDMRETIGILSSAARQIEPILRDVRIGTDKFATDPGGLIKRVLQNKPPGVGTKWGPEGMPLNPRR
ncbi:MAG: MCE family protein [Planctomycetes bacterium]|nr:MCE family protein [Planctomycetota bacterium]